MINMIINGRAITRKSGANFTITVTAEAGAAVTAAKGENTVSGIATDGTCVLTVPQEGDWLITAAKNGVTSAAVVSFSTAASADLLSQLVNYTMLYDAGDECTSVTGGWNKTDANGGNTVTKGTASLTMNYGGSGAACVVTTANNVNLPDYNGGGYVITPYSFIDSTYSTDMFTTAQVGVGHIVGSISGTLSAGVKTYKYDACDFPAQDKINVNCYDVSVYLNCAFVTKADEWGDICTIAGVTVPDTIDALLADSTSLSIILGNATAVNYMCRRCTGDFMAKAVASSTFKAALTASANKGAVLANIHWHKLLDMTGYLG